MKPMDEAPRDGKRVLAVLTDGEYAIAKYRGTQTWISNGAYLSEGCFLGWYDIDELIAAAEKAERYEKALREISEYSKNRKHSELTYKIAREALNA
jgi:hypothetical protein